MLHLLTSFLENRKMPSDCSSNWEVNRIRFPLKLIGLWPTCKKFFNVNFSTVAILAMKLLLPLTIQISFYNDETEVIFNILMWTIFTFINVQLWTFRIKNKSIGLLLHTMCNNWQRLDNRSPDDKNIMIEYAKKSRHATFIVYCFVFVGTTGSYFHPLLSKIISNKQRLYGDAWYPFSTSDSTVFTATLISQYISATALAIIFASVDCCIITVVFHCCGQLQILARKIENYKGALSHRQVARRIGTATRANCHCMKCIVEENISIITFVNLINTSFGTLMALRLILNTIYVCAAGFELMKLHNSGNNVALSGLYSIYIIAATPTFALSCWLGEQLLQHSDNLSVATYNVNWYGLSKMQASPLIILINCSKRSIHIVAGEYFVLSLHFFKEWCFTVFSYLSVLRTFASTNV